MDDEETANFPMILPMPTPQDRIDCFLQKITTDLVMKRIGGHGGKKASNRLHAYETVKAAHSTALVLDPEETVEPCLRRSTMHSVMSAVAQRCGKLVTVPKQIIIPENILCDEQVGRSTPWERLKEYVERQSDLSFPIIVKTDWACGTEHSHRMLILQKRGVVSSPSSRPTVTASKDTGLLPDRQYMPSRMIAQEYCPHGNTFLKVYVIGTEITVQSKPSLVLATDAGCAIGSKAHCMRVLFESDDLRVYEVDSQELRQYRGELHTDNERDMASIREIAQTIRAETGMGLFGFDVLPKTVALGKTDFVLVDINYFPGYKGMDGVCESLVGYCREKCSRFC